jgi:hypothetical protein
VPAALWLGLVLLFPGPAAELPFGVSRIDGLKVLFFFPFEILDRPERETKDPKEGRTQPSKATRVPHLVSRDIYAAREES